VTPAICCIVLYRLSERDAAQVNGNRHAATEMTRARSRYPVSGPFDNRNAYILHTGSHVSEGDQYPAVVVRTFEEGARLNLHVLLDGTDTYWATTRTEGDEPGQWSQPPRA
jgi:hypothetical protein